MFWCFSSIFLCYIPLLCCSFVGSVLFPLYRKVAGKPRWCAVFWALPEKYFPRGFNDFKVISTPMLNSCALEGKTVCQIHDLSSFCPFFLSHEIQNRHLVPRLYFHFFILLFLFYCFMLQMVGIMDDDDDSEDGVPIIGTWVRIPDSWVGLGWI